MAKTLKEKYLEEIKPALKEKLGVANEFQIPKIEKIVINFGLGDSASNAKTLQNAIKDLEDIAGQKPVITRAKKSISTYKVREGMALGLKVTLRRDRMYHFLSRLVNLAMPRIRDFQGISDKSFDGKGNYTFGVKEQLIFPEIKYDKVDAVRGMDITICTNAAKCVGHKNIGKADEFARTLLASLGMPFKRKKVAA